MWTAPQFAFFLAPAGAFNQNQEDPLPGRMKKQLVLKIISGQQLPKPKDSMLGDRGEVVCFIPELYTVLQTEKQGNLQIKGNLSRIEILSFIPTSTIQTELFSTIWTN